MPYDRNTSAGYLTNWAARLYARAVERRLIGGSSGPMPVFFALDRGQSLTQKQLAQMAAVEQPTMAATLARMERDGWIARTPDPADRRSSLIALTPLGRERAETALQVATEVNALGLSALRPEERELFLDMMRRMVAVLDADGSHPGS